MVTNETMPQGICPACGQVVGRDDDAVWTCRFNLDPRNAYHIRTSFSDYELECMRGPDSGSSLCLDDLYGELGACEGYDGMRHMPLHVTCYEEGNY